MDIVSDVVMWSRSVETRKMNEFLQRSGVKVFVTVRDPRRLTRWTASLQILFCVP